MSDHTKNILTWAGIGFLLFILTEVLPIWILLLIVLFIVCYVKGK